MNWTCTLDCLQGFSLSLSISFLFLSWFLFFAGFWYWILSVDALMWPLQSWCCLSKVCPFRVFSLSIHYTKGTTIVTGGISVDLMKTLNLLHQEAICKLVLISAVFHRVLWRRWLWLTVSLQIIENCFSECQSWPGQTVTCYRSYKLNNVCSLFDKTNQSKTSLYIGTYNSGSIGWSSGG